MAQKFYENTKFLKVLKSGKPLEIGLRFWIPNPKVKIVIIPGPRGKMIFTEEEYKKYWNGAAKTIDTAYDSLERQYSHISAGHDALKKATSENWVVSIFYGI